MYSKLPNLVLGFHGCKKDVFDEVVSGRKRLKASENVYDWLGHGIYFWEQNYQRAHEWAQHRYGKEAAVVGAVIDLGYCLNLTDSYSSRVLRLGYELLKIKCDIVRKELPENRKSNQSKDVLLRDLDCAVIQQIHRFNVVMNKPGFDSVRGIFTEGEPIYEGSEFLEKTHVQLCICNPNCIKGYFIPLDKNKKYNIP